MTPRSDECIKFEGSPEQHQREARLQYIVDYGELEPFSWVRAVCSTRSCINSNHLAVHAPVRISYPWGICIYCGRRAATKDHLLPRAWSGEAERHWVATVPACGTCNSLIGGTVTHSITERREIAKAGLRRKFRSALRTAEHTEEELSEYGTTLREYILDSLVKKRIVEEMLRFPEDAAYDLRALQQSGIEDPYAIGLLDGGATRKEAA